MKKKIIIAIVILAVIFIPIPGGTYKDGGTREYSCAAYKIVKWNRLVPYHDGEAFEEGVCSKTSVYWFPDNWKSIDELWEMEKNRL